MLSTAHLSICNIAAATAQVEYEFTEAESRTTNHPGTPADADIVAVTIGGVRIEDPESVFSDWQLETWRTRIVESATASTGSDAKWDARELLAA